MDEILIANLEMQIKSYYMNLETMMRAWKIGLVVFALAAVAGCATRAPRVYSVEQVLRVTPMVGETKYAALRDPVLHQREAQLMKGRLVEPPVQVQSAGRPYMAKGLFTLTQDGVYCGNLVYLSSLNEGQNRLTCWRDKHFTSLNVPYTSVEEPVPGTQGSQQLIEYGGLSGTTISLYYKTFSETAGALLRPESAQELKFDLNNGRIVEIEGARIEVLEATDRGLHYKLLSRFSS